MIELKCLLFLALNFESIVDYLNFTILQFNILLGGFSDEATLSWNTSTGELISILPSEFWVSSVALSADGAIGVTVSSSDKKALVWDVKTGTLLNTLLTGEGSVRSVALSHDGRIQVWNTKPLPGNDKTSIPLTVLEGHAKPVTTLAFGLDSLIASGSMDSTVIIWKPMETKSVTLE